MIKLLLVDDDAFYSNLYQAKLAAEGFDVHIARDGVEAVQYLRTAEPPGLIQPDLQMPRMDGMAVLTWIRASPRLRQVPVIVFSSTNHPATIEKAWQAGATRFLSKPLMSPNRVVEEVKDTLKQVAAGAPVMRAPLPAAPAGAEDVAPPDAPDQAAAPVDRAYEERWVGFVRAPTAVARQEALLDIYQLLQPQFTAARRADGLTRLNRLGRALEKLFEQLYETPGAIHLSTQRTLAQGLEIFTDYFTGWNPAGRTAFVPFALLADSDAARATAARGWLAAHHVRAVCLARGADLAAFLRDNPVDVVFTDAPDLDLPAALPRLRPAPRERYVALPLSALSDPRDVIAAPIFPAEFVLKMTVLALRADAPETPAAG